jgi:hypothetical protein
MNDVCVKRPISEQEIAEAISSSATEVFSTMLGMELVAGPMEVAMPRWPSTFLRSPELPMRHQPSRNRSGVDRRVRRRIG